jgi:hypothetical protein
VERDMSCEDGLSFYLTGSSRRQSFYSDLKRY